MKRAPWILLFSFMLAVIGRGSVGVMASGMLALNDVPKDLDVVPDSPAASEFDSLFVSANDQIPEDISNHVKFDSKKMKWIVSQPIGSDEAPMNVPFVTVDDARNLWFKVYLLGHKCHFDRRQQTWKLTYPSVEGRSTIKLKWTMDEQAEAEAFTLLAMEKDETKKLAIATSIGTNSVDVYLTSSFPSIHFMGNINLITSSHLKHVKALQRAYSCDLYDMQLTFELIEDKSDDECSFHAEFDAFHFKLLKPTKAPTTTASTEAATDSSGQPITTPSIFLFGGGTTNKNSSASNPTTTSAPKSKDCSCTLWIIVLVVFVLCFLISVGLHVYFLLAKKSKDNPGAGEAGQVGGASKATTQGTSRTAT